MSTSTRPIPCCPRRVRELLELGKEGSRRAWAALPRGIVRHDPANVRLLAPVPDPRKIICVGLNYRDHAAESGVPAPEEPVLFSKFPSALIGHGRVDRLAPRQQRGRLRGRAGGRHRPGRAAHPPRARPGARRRLRGRPRRLGPRLAAQQAGQAVDGRQDVRHLRPRRTRASSPPTRPATPTTWASACGSTARPCRTRTPTSSSSASTC